MTDRPVVPGWWRDAGGADRTAAAPAAQPDRNRETQHMVLTAKINDKGSVVVHEWMVPEAATTYGRLELSLSRVKAEAEAVEIREHMSELANNYRRLRCVVHPRSLVQAMTEEAGREARARALSTLDRLEREYQALDKVRTIGEGE